MRIGIISDVHSNLVALEAVLDDMPDVDELVCAGDVIGYNPWPSECLDIVRSECSTVVQGNHDRTVKSPVDYLANTMAYKGLELAREDLSSEQLEWLEELPKRADIGGGDILLAHSHPSPSRLGQYVYPADFPRIRKVLRKEYDDRYWG